MQKDPAGLVIALLLIIWSVSRMQNPAMLLFALMVVLVVAFRRMAGM